MRILAIDTSTSTARIAIAGGGAVMKSAEAVSEDAENQPSRNLLSMINRLLAESGIALDMVDVFAVSAGPGSFTGLRIGLGAALGLSAATGKPTIGVETLASMASAHSSADTNRTLVCPILAARKGEVYAAFFKKRGDVMERVSEDMALAPEKLAEMIDEPVDFIGGGFRANAEVLTRKLKTDFTAVDAPLRNTAEAVAELALAGRAVITPVSLRYVRPSQAELNWEKLHAI
ncbi:MAG: tRNA (adenosine(37)-N6)-threonylcarbamoyltransferase complex dimerization subunit type 1 TsaB [Nitrospinae bacterium]|nr:tRNA (adenosine(37)-N6)-threonylcarbamoyltransferase complex dimerization subunit type 1 TsaB [Nitrospinota bacterium]